MRHKDMPETQEVAMLPFAEILLQPKVGELWHLWKSR